MPTENFNRLVVVQFNDREYRSRPLPGFRIDASVTLKRGTLPKATLKIYNIGREQEDAILNAKRRDLRVRILAGYEEDDTAQPPLIFDGNILRDGGSLKKGETDRVLKVDCKEGAIAFSGPVDINFSGQATVGDVVGAFLTQVTKIDPRIGSGVDRVSDLSRQFGQGLQDLAQAATGVQEVLGDAADFVPADRADGLRIGTLAAIETFKTALPPGIAFSGDAGDVKRQIENTAGIEMPVRAGYIEIYDRRKPRTRRGPLISYRTGNLLETPEPKSNNKVGLKALLTPQLAPGDRFEVESIDDQDSGIYVCLEHTMNIASGYANQFYSKIVARRDP